MNYKNEIREAVFIERLNRFEALVELDGEVVRVHVRNTGRCREILVRGSRVFLEKAAQISAQSGVQSGALDSAQSDGRTAERGAGGPGVAIRTVRKTGWSVVAAWKGDVLINIDSGAPNRVVGEALELGRISEFGSLGIEPGAEPGAEPGLEPGMGLGLGLLKREAGFGGSRLDFYYERKNGAAGFIEVKGVTLEQGGKLFFPDAPTERGTRHLRELIRARQEGYEAAVFFLVQLEMKCPGELRPNRATDPDFADALAEAKNTGVKIIAYDCKVTPGSININNIVTVIT